MMAREGNQIRIVQRGVNVWISNEQTRSFMQPVSHYSHAYWAQLKAAVTKALPIKSGFNRWLRLMVLQFALYSLIVTGAISATFMGSDVMLSMLSEKMTEMASSVVLYQVPAGIETAELRPTLQ
ncbi:hypothetical protein [Cohaesibacter celericrescens]|uniref:hypothetical protein n=1 Tax=Cohaesibacter celericrescens TaxID=2067669 RepID=UPI003569138A